MEENLDDLPIHPVSDLIKIRGAGGQDVPFTGYVEARLTLQMLPSQPPVDHDCLLLVVEDTSYSARVPVVVGTNVIKPCLGRVGDRYRGCPTAWNLAFHHLTKRDKFLSRTKTPKVQATNTKCFTVQAHQTVVVWGKVRTDASVGCYDAYTQAIPQANISGCLTVIPSVSTISQKMAHVPVQLTNTSSRPIKIHPKSTLCGLEFAERVGPITDSTSPESPTATVQSQSMTAEAQSSGSSSSAESPKYGSQAFDLDQTDLTSAQKYEARTELSGYEDVISQSRHDNGVATAEPHRVPMTDESPFKHCYRRIPPAQYDEVRALLKDMQDAGTIRESHSPYASPIVLVRKKDGSLRLCIDYRTLNKRTVKDNFPLPRIDDTLDALYGAKWFSSLDLKSGYWQIEMAEADKPKTAFTTPLGFYECNRMPFGLTNAPATFQRLMERCLGDLNLKQCLVYLDDIIVYSATFEEHLTRLKAVLDRLREYNLKLQPTKCHLFRRSINYLGHVISAKGISTDPDKIDALRSWPTPSDVTQLRSFLGFAGYYRRFVKDYSKIAKPLNALLGTPAKKKARRRRTKSTVPWCWSPECQTAFNTIKQKLMEPPVLAYADFSQPFILHTDACTSAKLDATGQRWLAALSAYDFSLSYRPGTKNGDADGLSRRPHPFSVDKTQPADHESLPVEVTSDVVQVLCAHHLTSNSGKESNNPAIEAVCCNSQIVLPVLDDTMSTQDGQPVLPAISMEEWRRLQEADPTIKRVIELKISGTRPSPREEPPAVRNLLREWDRLHLHHNVLHRVRKVDEQRTFQLVVPPSHRDRAFQGIHDDVGHFGCAKTVELARQRFYWPGMLQNIWTGSSPATGVFVVKLPLSITWPPYAQCKLRNHWNWSAWTTSH